MLKCIMRGDVIWLCGIGLCFLFGCEGPVSHNDPPIRTAKAPVVSVKPPASSSADKSDVGGTVERDFGGAVFQVPQAWEEKPKRNDVIAAEFGVPGSAGPGRLTLSSATGGLTANVQRWKDQFQPDAESPDVEESTLSVNGKESTLVELFGTFRDGFSGGEPQRDWAMLGVVIPLKSSGGAYFVKLTGPRETIAAARDTFIKFVESATFND